MEAETSDFHKHISKDRILSDKELYTPSKS